MVSNHTENGHATNRLASLMHDEGSRIERLEQEIAQLKAAQVARNDARIAFINELPGKLGLKTHAEVIELLQGGAVAPIATVAARSFKRRHKHRAFITDSKRALIIKALDADRQSISALHRRFGVSRQTLYAIKSRVKQARDTAIKVPVVAPVIPVAAPIVQAA